MKTKYSYPWPYVIATFIGASFGGLALLMLVAWLLNDGYPL